MNTPAALQTRLMSMKEWLFDFSDEPFELIDGEKIMWSPSVSGSHYTAQILRDALNDFVRGKNLGEPMMEATFAFTEDPQWVRKSLVPDVAFVTADKLAAFRAKFPNWKELPYLAVPDFVAEVVSPTDRYAKVKRKAARYLEEGVAIIWIIDYLEQKIEIITADGEIELGASGVLTLPDLLPGFELNIETLFA